MAKTIKQMADELGVSKTAVRKKIIELGMMQNLEKNGNQFAINEQQEKVIKMTFSNGETETKTETETETETQTIYALVAMLQKELDAKNKQIDELNSRLAECQKLLDQQQQLQALTRQQPAALPEKRHWWWNRKREER